MFRVARPKHERRRFACGTNSGVLCETIFCPVSQCGGEGIYRDSESCVRFFTKYLVPGVSRGRGRCVAPFALLQREHAELGSAAGREGGGLLPRDFL